MAVSSWFYLFIFKLLLLIFVENYFIRLCSSAGKRKFFPRKKKKNRNLEMFLYECCYVCRPYHWTLSPSWITWLGSLSLSNSSGEWSTKVNSPAFVCGSIEIYDFFFFLTFSWVFLGYLVSVDSYMNLQVLPQKPLHFFLILFRLFLSWVSQAPNVVVVVKI